MKILFFVLVVCAVLLREVVLFSVWLVRKILKKDAKPRSALSLALRHMVFPLIALVAAFFYAFPNRLPRIENPFQLSSHPASVENTVFGGSSFSSLYFSADGFVYEALRSGGGYYFRDVLYHYEEDGEGVVLMDARGKEKRLYWKKNALVEAGNGDGETFLPTSYRARFTAQPNALSGRAFRGETESHLGIESQFTVIFYENGEYALGWRYIGDGHLKGGDREDYFGIYEYNARTKKVLLPEAGHWCRRDFVYDSEKNTLTGKTDDGDEFVMTEISFEELGLFKNETILKYGKESNELGASVLHYSRLGSQVEHSAHRLNWSNYEKRFTRLNDYVFYRLYMRNDMEKYKVERNYVPFVPSADYPDSFAVVTRRNEVELGTAQYERVGVFAHTDYHGTALNVFDVPQDNVVAKFADVPLYVEYKVWGNFATAWYQVYSVRFDEERYPHKGEELGWMVHYDVRFYGDIAVNFADSAEDLQKRHKAEPKAEKTSENAEAKADKTAEKGRDSRRTAVKKGAKAKKGTIFALALEGVPSSYRDFIGRGGGYFVRGPEEAVGTHLENGWVTKCLAGLKNGDDEVYFIEYLENKKECAIDDIFIMAQSDDLPLSKYIGKRKNDILKDFPLGKGIDDCDDADKLQYDWADMTIEVYLEFMTVRQIKITMKKKEDIGKTASQIRKEWWANHVGFDHDFQVERNGSEVAALDFIHALTGDEWKDRKDPSAVLEEFFISYFSQNDEWKSLVAAGHDREELIAQMQKAHGEFYGKVDKIRIIINPAKFKDSSGGRAFHTVSIAYTNNGDADVKIDEVAMMQDGGGNWFVVALPM